MNRRLVNYSLGYTGQGAAYNFISTYFIVFMTDCVGMSSSLSSMIMSLALLVEVAAGMVIGNISDQFHSRLGRRRPFVLISALTMPPILLLLFRSMNFSMPVAFAYYLLFSILFRLSFSTFEIPYSAFGAEIATGYDERTKLRTVSRVCGILGNMTAYLAPLFIVDLFAQAKSGWSATAILIAAVCFTTWMYAFFTTKEKQNGGASNVAKDQKEENGAAEKKQAVGHRNVVKEIFLNYLELAKLKTMRILIVYKAAFACALALFNIGTVYYMRYCAGMSNRYISYVYFITVGIFFCSTPFINAMALKLGKGMQQKLTLGLAGVVGLIIYLFFRNTTVGTFVYIVLFAAAQNSFWQLSPSIFYDIVEVDEFAHNKRREGDIMSLVSVLGTLTTALIVQIFGICFDLSGYNPDLAAQGNSVVSFLNIAYVLLPSLCFLTSAFALKTFPINKKTFASLSAAVALKREGKDYSQYNEDLQKIFK